MSIESGPSEYDHTIEEEDSFEEDTTFDGVESSTSDIALSAFASNSTLTVLVAIILFWIVDMLLL